MSTLAYAMITRKREKAPAGTSKDESPPGVGFFLDALGALVPAEVLALHAFAISQTTATMTVGGKTVTTITNPGTLKATFAALIVICIALYVLPHIGLPNPSHWDWEDWIRMFIPPLAFVGWTMLQTNTAFDAIAPGFVGAPRVLIAVIGALVLGLIAARLGYSAHTSPSH